MEQIIKEELATEHLKAQAADSDDGKLGNNTRPYRHVSKLQQILISPKQLSLVLFLSLLPLLSHGINNPFSPSPHGVNNSFSPLPGANIITDDENEAEEYESWKVRELRRIKTVREAREAREREVG